MAERRESARDARAAKAIILDFFILTFHNLEVRWGGIEGSVSAHGREFTSRL
jgi:hypothetical protein